MLIVLLWGAESIKSKRERTKTAAAERQYTVVAFRLTSTNTPRPKCPQHWWQRFRVLASILVSTSKASGTPVDARHSSDIIGEHFTPAPNVI
jgi:hypothetical protein